METTKFGQTFYKSEADLYYPEGCQCGNNGGGDCDWCQVYYGYVKPWIDYYSRPRRKKMATVVDVEDFAVLE